MAPRPQERLKLGKWALRGQGLVEYALIMVMIAIVILVILTFIGQVVSQNMYSKINSGFPG